MNGMIRKLFTFNKLIRVKSRLQESYKADISSVNPSSERIKELLVVCGSYRKWGSYATYGNVVTGTHG